MELNIKGLYYGKIMIFKGWIKFKSDNISILKVKFN